MCEGQVRDCTGQLHPGQSTERVDETTVERRLAFGLVVSGVQGEAQRDRGVRVEAFFDGQDLDQTANKQPGPCQQDYGQRQLGDNHSPPKTTSRAFNASASCLSQDSGRIATRNGQGRKQTIKLVNIETPRAKNITGMSTDVSSSRGMFPGSNRNRRRIDANATKNSQCTASDSEKERFRK